jgi:hypothetical protein
MSVHQDEEDVAFKLGYRSQRSHEMANGGLCTRRTVCVIPVRFCCHDDWVHRNSTRTGWFPSYGHYLVRLPVDPHATHNTQGRILLFTGHEMRGEDSTISAFGEWGGGVGKGWREQRENDLMMMDT